MNTYRGQQIYLFFFTSILIVSCTSNKRVDVSNISLNVRVERFDQELTRLTPQNLSQKAPLLKLKYGNFYNDFMSRILGVGSTADTAYYKDLRTVLENKDYLELRKSVEAKYPDVNIAQNQLTEAFKHVRYYYPKQKLPRLISFFSGFSVQTPIGNDYMGIGLDMFLGSDSKFYPALRQSIPQYISNRFSPENITPRVIEGFAREELFPEKDQDKSLLSKMINNGKILYFMDRIMPDIADSLKIGYTQKQLEWCQNYESSIWAYILENELLYETDYMKIQKYLTEAPFTPGIGNNSESAPKLGVWVGWQIVRKYMDKNPETSLQQLMKETEAQKILNEAKYKPKTK